MRVVLSACCPCRSLSGHFAESVGARMTVLEGRVKLMEAQVGREQHHGVVCVNQTQNKEKHLGVVFADTLGQS
jgi:hypothetical protein